MNKFPLIIVPFMKTAGMAVFPFILVSDKALKKDEVLIRHETIHLIQQAELVVIPFYVIYLINYLFNRFRYLNHQAAYENICFEREAYANENDTAYLPNRKLWNWMKYW